MLKKSLLAASIASVVSVGAMAGTWTATSGAPDFADDLFGSGSDVTVLTVPEASYAMAATPGAGSAFNITYTLTGATWGADLVSGDLTYGAGNGGAVSITLVEDGLDEDSTATFRVDVSASINSADTFNLAYSLDDFGGSSAKLAVSLVDGLGAVDTAGSATTVADTVDATVGTDAAAADLTIDVATNSAQFITGSTNFNTAVLGSVSFADNAAVVADNVAVWDSTAGVDATGGLDGAALVVTGDFAAAVGTDADDNTATADGAWLDLDDSGTYDAGEEATTLTATSATWDLSAADATTVMNGATFDVYMDVDGVTSMSESGYTSSITLDRAESTYIDEAFAGTFANTAKNGDTVDLDLILTPNGVFSNFIRITNKSSVAGDVFVTVFNDVGDSVSINLSDIDGQDSDALVGNGSTSLINVNDLYAAAQVEDPTFATDATANKLRVRIEGEFGDIEAQNLSLATDNTYFGTF